MSLLKVANDLMMAAADGMCSLLNLSTAQDAHFSTTHLTSNRTFCSIDAILIAQLYLIFLFLSQSLAANCASITERPISTI